MEGFMNNVIVTLTGPSGSGKSTLESVLKTKGFISLISTTTRAPRTGEVDGKNYYFVDKSEFKRLKEQGAFVEDVEFNGEYYGLFKHEVDKLRLLNSPAVIVVEPHGKAQIEKYAKSISLECLRIFIDIDQEEQMERLLSRFHSDISAFNTVDFNGRKKYFTTKTNHARRFVMVMTEERKWLADAYERENGVLVNYDHIIAAFDGSTAEAAVSRVEMMADEILAKQSKAADLEAA